MDAVRDRLRERTLDVLDWIDYRPDPHYWPFLCVPAIIASAYYFTPMNLWPIILAFAALATIFALIVSILALIALVAWRTMRDVIGAKLRRRRARQPSYAPRILVGRLS